MNDLTIAIIDKRLKRAGKEFLNNIFLEYRGVTHFNGRKNNLQAADALLIFNTLGLKIEIIYLLCIANGLDGIDLDGFKKILEEQKERLKNTKQC